MITQLSIMALIVVAAFAIDAWLRTKDELDTVKGQLEAEQRKVAMIHAARSEASRKGWQTKARRIHLPDGQA